MITSNLICNPTLALTLTMHKADAAGHPKHHKYAHHEHCRHKHHGHVLIRTAWKAIFCLVLGAY